MQMSSLCSNTCVGLPLMLLMVTLNGCSDPEAEKINQKVVHVMIKSFADEAVILARDCGHDKMTSSNLFSALIQNLEWPGWKGPYYEAIPNDP